MSFLQEISLLERAEQEKYFKDLNVENHWIFQDTVD